MSIIAAPSSPAGTHAQEAIRVMVVDDAIVVRALVARWVDAEPDMGIVASLRSGREAIEQVERVAPDVVVLDVDMPDIDGITALPRLLERQRDLVVLMSSTLTRRNAEVSLRALALGATDYIPKPQTNREFSTSPAFRRELIDKIRALGTRKRRKAGLYTGRLEVPKVPGAAPIRERVVEAVPSLVPDLVSDGHHAGSRKLRPFPAAIPRVLLIGSSTGGPQAVNAVINGIGAVIDQAPVLITQHMPPTFTTIFAEHLARASGRPVAEAQHGEPVCAGHIYVAPGGHHMRVVRGDNGAQITLDDGAPINFCKPAVDPMFSSAAAVWGGSSLALVLTGMGSDGARGAAEIVAAGGGVVAQDEATSVVWGMPGSVANAGLCSAILPLDQIAPRIVRLFSGGRS
jgi:two-component system, chemotaxis family, protein-glutamate methylesterase/glutaminase